MFVAEMIPFVIVILIYNLLTAKSQDDPHLLIDQTGITVRRDKTLTCGIYAMNVLIDGKKNVTLKTGQTKQVPLPMGTYRLSVLWMGKQSESIPVSVSGNEPLSFEAGVRQGTWKSSPYIEKSSELNN